MTASFPFVLLMGGCLWSSSQLLETEAFVPLPTSNFFIQTTTTTTTPRIELYAAAKQRGGGGGFGAKKASTNPKNDKRKKGSSSGGLLTELELPKSTQRVQQVKQQNPKEPELDKWGLPPPTLDDIFPPMPPDTELIPLSKDETEYTLSDIERCLEKHMSCLIQDNHLRTVFDPNGVQKCVSNGREPMKLRLLHQSPPVLKIENFLTADECLEMEQVAMPSSNTKQNSNVDIVQVDSATFSSKAVSKRTSTSWFCTYKSVPTLLAKAHAIFNIPLCQMEEPQIVRYQAGQEFSWHYDEVPAAQLSNGGQRIATLLVYFNTVPKQGGGGTIFRDLTNNKNNDNNNGQNDNKRENKNEREEQQLCMRPVQGSALLFFPAYADGKPDDRTLHKGEVVQPGYEKRIIQMWIHQSKYRATLPTSQNYQTDAIPAINQICKMLGYKEIFST